MSYLINPSWVRRGPPKVWTERKKRSFRKLLQIRAKGLQSQKKISDVWFQNLWVESGMHIAEGPKRDRFNEPFIFYIPDCVNFFYRYVIEVDDPSHRAPKRRATDRKKDRFYAQSGYTVFRIKSHDYNGFIGVKESIRIIRRVKDEDGQGPA